MRLANVLLPRRVRGFDDGLPDTQAYDVVLEGPRVAQVRASAGAAEGLLLPGFVEAHAHIDKTYTVHETGAAHGDLFTAIERMAQRRGQWTAEDIRPRMERAVEEAWRSGTRALRTHIDWTEPQPPAALAVFEELRARWQGRIELQFVSLTPLDLFDDAAAGEAIAGEVARAGGVLGAFVYRNDRLGAKLDRVFDLARRHGLALDFHVDEGLHADATGLRQIAARATQDTVIPAQAGIPGGPGGAHREAGDSRLRGNDERKRWTDGKTLRIACSHCCSLSVQPAQDAKDTLAACVQAGIDLIALPATNLYLQGAWDATPLERGITRVREAAALGLRPILGTDNVNDAFFPYGCYDTLEAFVLGVQVAHLAPVLDWVDAITTRPAQALGLAWDGRIAPGCPADLVLLQARDEFELLMPAGRRRTVIRNGQPL
jgi:cytosine deaminase